MSAVHETAPRSHSAEGRPGLPEFTMRTPWGSVTGEGVLAASAAEGSADPGEDGASESVLLETARGADSAMVGMLPFDPHRPARFLVPRTWTRTSAPEDGPVRPPSAVPVPLAVPSGVTGLDNPAYREAVATAVGRIHAGVLQKIVLARLLQVDYSAQDPLDPAGVYARLLAQHPRAYVFSVAEPTGSGFHMAASPELVMSVRDRICTTHPLAGSASRAGAEDPTEDLQIGEELMRSPKDRGEHATVIEDIARRLRPLCEELDVPAAPSLLATPQLWHLGTRITGRLKPGVTSLDAARAIHPTPAICGSPRQTALEMVQELEPADRGWFGGLVGWTDATGDGEWALNLRSARVTAQRATLFAGAGIVRGSTPAGEHAETGTKLSTFLAALGLDAQGRPLQG